MKVRLWMLVISISINSSLCANKPIALTAPAPKGEASHLNSYLPAAMQILAHFTNQMKYEREPDKPQEDATTEKIRTTTSKIDLTTQSHKPGIFAPIPPPPEIIPGSSPLKADLTDAVLPPIVDIEKTPPYPETLFLPGFHQNEPNLPVIPDEYPESQYSILPAYPYKFSQDSAPQPSAPTGPLYFPGNYQGQPYTYSQLSPIARSGEDDAIVPDISSLPVQNEDNFKSNPLEIEPEELSDENLQYLSPVIRDMLRGVRDNDDNIDNWNPTVGYQSIEQLYDDSTNRNNVDLLRLKKAAPTQTLIQMLLMYDLLSRDAKKQKLNKYQGYTEDLITDLSETSKGTAIEQLKVVLDRMVARGDCTHDFANNRAKDMMKELDKPDSKLSMQVRYLEPLHFTE
ncbi:ecdysone-inducible gene E3 [Arctopsyche grandis]|uniref:ecdysone-inducible gene E3 n=1 Tax=Arctopsyche grandis TaxID=121162 RepID=UPI00406D8FD6